MSKNYLTNKEEIEAMESIINSLSAPEAEKVACINAIHALVETMKRRENE